MRILILLALLLLPGCISASLAVRSQDVSKAPEWEARVEIARR